MGKHTQGRWFVEDFYDRCQRFRVKSTAKRGSLETTICALGSSRSGRTSEHNIHAKIDAEDEANARLIAAAPETAAERDRLKTANAAMLEALKAAHPFVQDAIRRFDTGDTQLRAAEVSIAIKAALAAAEPEGK